MWLVAGGCGSPYLFFYETVAIPSPEGGQLAYCIPNQKYDINMPVFVTCNFLLFYILPLILMTVLYIKISIVLWRSSKQGSVEQHVVGRNTQKPALFSSGIRLAVFNRHRNRKRQARAREYNSVPNIVVISAAPVASRENSPTRRRNPPGQAADTQHAEDRLLRNHYHYGYHAADQNTGHHHQGALVQDAAPGSVPSGGYFCPSQDAAVGQDATQPEACVVNGLEACDLDQDHMSRFEPDKGSQSSSSSMDRFPDVNHGSEARVLRTRPVQTHVVRSAAKTEPKKKEGALLARRKVIRLLMAVLISFSICVFPYHLRVMYQTWMEQEVSFTGLLMVPVTFVIYYTNSGLNPILYAFLSENFRRSLREVLTCSVSRPRPVYSLRNGTGGSVRTAQASL